MITVNDGVFKLDTLNTSYIFSLHESGHLINVHYGARVDAGDVDALRLKLNAGFGSSVNTAEGDKLFCLDAVCLEFPCTGRGDYRHPPLEIKMPDKSYVNEFVYHSHRVTEACGDRTKSGLPLASDAEGGAAQTLEVTLKDKLLEVYVTLHYAVFEECDVICRRAVLRNDEKEPLVLRRLMSFNLDLPSSDFVFVTFDGGWIKEASRHETLIGEGVYVNESVTGYSSNRHNAGFALKKQNASEDAGSVYAFNLVYSGNHYGAVEKSNGGLLRVMSGINPHCFEFDVPFCGEFETPQAVLTYSGAGMNGISQNMGEFVRRHIVRSKHRTSARPVLVNNWEAHFFDFNERKLVKLAKQGAKAGAELFVLDDGWFGGRDSDTAGLGDYNVNRKKLPCGLERLSKRIKKAGLDFGLWFEPEMVNENSRLYRDNPDFAVAVPRRRPCFGRNQLVLDLCNPSVRDYIVENVVKTAKSAGVSYIKWDCNRHISDAFSPFVANQGEFFHRQILGLYDVLHRITSALDDVLFESCSSGGNRFDLGLLCFMPQIWCSDNTDPIARLDIQGGLSCLYPQSVFGAHVSMSPHQQTMRLSPLNTRFNVAAFGLLGYELDFKHLTHSQKKVIKEQIAFYKAHRRTFQYGVFKRLYTDKDNRVVWQVTGGDEIIVGIFQKLAAPSPQSDILYVQDTDDNAVYTIETRPQRLEIRRFGALIKHALPLKLNPDGLIIRTVNKYYTMSDATEKYRLSGAALRQGVKLNQPFTGTWYNPTIRFAEGDFASNLYIIKKENQAQA